MASHYRMVWLASLLAVAAFTICACNTVKGIGRDIEAGAETVEDALDKD